MPKIFHQMTQIMILTFQSLGFGREYVLALSVSLFLEVEVEVDSLKKRLETLTSKKLFIGFPYWV